MEEGEVHIYRGVNRNTRIWEHRCPKCGSLTYLGKFIPTVRYLTAEYMDTIFRCHNLNCDPIYDEEEIDWDENGDPCEPYICYDLKDYGAYWDAEDEYYYTPQSPRL